MTVRLDLAHTASVGGLGAIGVAVWVVKSVEGKAPSHEIVMMPTLAAPGFARRELGGWFAFAIPELMFDSARLLVSELVTNAVVHGSGIIRLRAALSDGRLLVEVFDEGDGFAWARHQRGPDDFRAGGWGLALVECEANRCGVSLDPTRVWFELNRQSTAQETM